MACCRISDILPIGVMFTRDEIIAHGFTSAQVNSMIHRLRRRNTLTVCPGGYIFNPDPAVHKKGTIISAVRERMRLLEKDGIVYHDDLFKEGVFSVSIARAKLTIQNLIVREEISTEYVGGIKAYKLLALGRKGSSTVLAKREAPNPYARVYCVEDFKHRKYENRKQSIYPPATATYLEINI